MSEIRHLVGLYFHMFKLNLKSVSIYHKDFIFGVVAMILKCVMNFSLLFVLFLVIDDIDGWTFDEMMFLYGFSVSSYAIWHCFFINTITIPTFIQGGELDRFLVKPVNPILLIMMYGFDEDGWGELIFGIGVLVVAIIRLGILSPLLLLLPIYMFFGSLVFAGISIILAAVSFFTIGESDVTDITMEVQELAKYPIPIFGQNLGFILTFVLPLGFAAFYPSVVFLRPNLGAVIFFIITPGVCTLFFFTSYCIWRRALRRYSSCGS